MDKVSYKKHKLILDKCISFVDKKCEHMRLYNPLREDFIILQKCLYEYRFLLNIYRRKDEKKKK